MNRKDYELLAAALASVRPRAEDGSPAAAALALQWLRDVQAITKALDSDNLRFVPSKFMDACLDGE